MKIGPVTKLDKRNKTTSKKPDDDVMSENCDVIDIFRIFGQFRAVRRPDSRHKVCKSYFSINSNLLSWKKRKTKQTKHSSHTIALSEGTFLDNFLQNNADISKVKAA